MRCCLINAPTTNEFTDKGFISRIDRYPPLGVLTLASSLRAGQLESRLVDVNDLYANWIASEPRSRTRSDFAVFAASHIAATKADVFGFSTICSSYPLTIRMAMVVKDAYPESHIILGGPQASSVAEETLRAFNSIDVIVRGEAEETLPLLLHELQTNGDLRRVRGLTFRIGSDVISSRDSDVIGDLDTLPLPAFDLYEHMGELQTIPIEAGRGCPFDCSFCATSRFFRRCFRMKSPALLLSQIFRLRKLYAVDQFSLIHDNFTVNKAKVYDFCNGLLKSGMKISWGCSARTDGLDPETIDLMASAGCHGIFLGVESGSRRMQHIIGKNLDLTQAKRCIRYAYRRKVRTDVSLIIGFPEETLEDIRKTTRFFIHTLRCDSASPQISLLAPLPGTRVAAANAKDLSFTELVSDLAFQGWRMNRADRKLVLSHPGVFLSFYTLPTKVDREYIFELRRFLLWAGEYSRWLLVALQDIVGDPLRAFDTWRRWVCRTGRKPAKTKLAVYYQQQTFRRDFLDFMRTVIVRRYPSKAHVVRALVNYEASLSIRSRTKKVSIEGAPDGVPTLDSQLMLADNVALKTVRADYAQILQFLRCGIDLAGVRKCRMVLATRFNESHIEIIQVAPLAVEILELCNGKRALGSIMEAYVKRYPTMKGIDGRVACKIGVLSLIKQQLIRDRGSR